MGAKYNPSYSSDEHTFVLPSGVCGSMRPSARSFSDTWTNAEFDRVLGELMDNLHEIAEEYQERRWTIRWFANRNRELPDPKRENELIRKRCEAAAAGRSEEPVESEDAEDS